MIGIVSIKYVLRSLLRNPRRTFLSVLGVGIGCAIGQMAASWMRGAAEMQIRAASESGAGHVRVVPAQWLETRENSLRLVNSEKILQEVKTLQGLKSFVQRARTTALLAFGTRIAGVEMVGVEPEAEQVSNRIVRKGKIEGRYLHPGDSGNVVIGKGVAKRLDVELHDDLLVTLSGRNEMRSDMLSIIGIIETGSRDLDAAICHVTLQDVGRLTDYEGPGEIAIMLEGHKLIEPTCRTLAERLADRNTAIVTWKEVSPELAANVEGDTAFTNTIIAIVILMVVFGIASAHLTAVLERRHEFAVLSALGMKGGRIAGLIFLEAVVIGLGGAVLALLIASPVTYYLATEGVNIANLAGGDLSFGDVLLDPYIYGDFGIWLVWYALGVSVMATWIASIYPAVFAMRTNPADELRRV